MSVKMMTCVLRNKLRFVMLCSFFCISTVYADSDGSASMSLFDVVGDVVELQCSDTVFLKYANLNKANCVAKMKAYTVQCDENVRPLIPNVSGTDDDMSNLQKVRKLGELYSLCLRALAYEDSYASRKDLR